MTREEFMAARGRQRAAAMCNVLLYEKAISGRRDFEKSFAAFEELVAFHRDMFAPPVTYTYEHTPCWGLRIKVLAVLAVAVFLGVYLAMRAP